MNASPGCVVLTFILSAECGCLEAVLKEIYRQQSLHKKGIGESVLEQLFCTIAVDGVNSVALEVRQKNFNAIQFYNLLARRLRQSYDLMALEM